MLEEKKLSRAVYFSACGSGLELDQNRISGALEFFLLTHTTPQASKFPHLEQTCYRHLIVLNDGDLNSCIPLESTCIQWLLQSSQIEPRFCVCVCKMTIVPDDCSDASRLVATLVMINFVSASESSAEIHGFGYQWQNNI